MKKTLLIIAGIALFVGPALAQKSTQSGQSGMKARAEQQQLPRLFVGPGLVRGNDVYDCTGKYLGSDPDPHVQQQLMKEGDKDVCGH
jgi:hypothetical protein